MKNPSPSQIAAVMGALGRRTSERKAAASRANGAKSKGPKKYQKDTVDKPNG